MVLPLFASLSASVTVTLAYENVLLSNNYVMLYVMKGHLLIKVDPPLRVRPWSGIARHALPRFSGSGVPVRVPIRFQQPSIMPQRAFQPTFTRCMGRNSSYEPKTTDEADELVDKNLRKMTKLVSGDSGGGEVKRWPKDPWKVKRQNYTRHVLNLTKKGKASITAHVITWQHQSLC